jgi:hypothetical protein
MGTINHIKTSAIADGPDTNVVRPSDWNSAHAYTLQDAVSLSGNTAGALANISSGTFYLAGGNNITLSQDANSVTISGGAGGGVISSYENLPGANFSSAQTLNGASVSVAVAFLLPQAGSFSFLRIPVQMTTNSTALNSVLFSMNASVEFRSTWNAVVYSLGAGANSASLQSVASGSAGFTFQNSISVATNGSQGSYTQAFSAQANGNGTTVTTQYSASSLNYPFSTTAFANFTGLRFLDIPWANSLSAGAYWLIFGYSSATATNSTGISAASNCNVRYSNHFGVSQLSAAVGIMGSTNLTSGGWLGAASFSTAGGGTTASLPISALSSYASYQRPYFNLLRSA